MSQAESDSGNSSRTLVRGASIVGALTFLSRILGFVRDIVVALVFGAGMLTDTFVVAFRLPNLLRSLFAEGAMTSAFVPVFCGELAKGAGQARTAIRAATGMLLTVTVLISVLGVVFAPQVVSVISPGFTDDPLKFDLCVRLTQIMFPYIIFVSLVALLGGALNSIRIFGMPAVAQILMNVALIAGALIAAFYDKITGLLILAVSVIAGGIVQVVVQIPALRRSGFSLWPSRHVFSPVNRQILLLMLPAIIGANIYQIMIFLSTLLASMLTDGSQSWLFFADRLVQLPIGIFSIALASVLLPMLSHHAARSDQESFGRNLSDSLRYTSFVIIPAAFLLFYLAEPLVVLLFERGAFNHHSSLMTALAVQASAIGLWAISCNSLLKSAFMARKDTVTPTLMGLFTLLVNIPLAILLMGPPLKISTSYVARILIEFRELPGLSWLAMDFKHAGLGLASSAAYLMTFFLLLILLHRKVGIDLSRFRVTTIRSILAATLMVSALYWLLPPASLPAWKEITLALPLAGIVYLGTSFLSGSGEVREIFELVARKIRKK